MKIKKKRCVSLSAVRLRDFTATAISMGVSEYGAQGDRDLSLTIIARNVRPVSITGRGLEDAVAEGLEPGLWAVFGDDSPAAVIVEVEP